MASSKSGTVPVPDHRELRTGTLLSIIRQSGVPRSAFEAPLSERSTRWHPGALKFASPVNPKSINADFNLKSAVVTFVNWETNIRLKWHGAIVKIINSVRKVIKLPRKFPKIISAEFKRNRQTHFTSSIQKQDL